MIRIQQKRSLIRVNEKQKKTVRSLGLRHIGHVRCVEDNSCIRGMLKKTNHLVNILEEGVTKESSQKNTVKKDSGRNK